MARTSNPAPTIARSAAGTATDPAPAPVPPPAADSPAAAVLAALTAEPGGATVAVIAGHAGISVAAARQALAAHEKAGTATRVKGSRPGIADTWKPAAGQAAPSPDPDAASTRGTRRRGHGRPGGRLPAHPRTRWRGSTSWHRAGAGPGRYRRGWRERPGGRLGGTCLILGS